VAAARAALKRNRGRDWARAPGAVRAKYLRAIAAKVRLPIRSALLCSARSWFGLGPKLPLPGNYLGGRFA